MGAHRLLGPFLEQLQGLFISSQIICPVYERLSLSLYPRQTDTPVKAVPCLSCSLIRAPHSKHVWQEDTLSYWAQRLL